MAAFSLQPTLLLLLLSIFLPFLSSAGRVSVEFIYPGFTTTAFHFVDTAGVFLTSRSGAFIAVIRNPGRQQSRFYLAVVHVPSDTIIWSANRNAPVSSSGLVVLSTASLSVLHPGGGSPLWSTPRLRSSVTALQLLETGNFRLIDTSNATLWQSFDHPTDTLLLGQPLQAGSYLISAVSNSDLSESDYRLIVTTEDAIMLWKGSQQYWNFSTDPSWSTVSNHNGGNVGYMATNATGIYLFSNSSMPEAVFKVILPPAEFRIAKLDSTGQFRILSNASSSSSSLLDNEVTAPSSSCHLPLACKSLGLCTARSNGIACSCPMSFGDSHAGGCSPSNSSLFSSCAEFGTVSYLSLGSGIGYFANRFAMPISSGSDISSCRNHCTNNCSCMGFFYSNSSSSCYLMGNYLGSFFDTEEPSNGIGYIKTVSSPSNIARRWKPSSIHLVAIIVPTVVALLLVVVLSLIWWRRSRGRSTEELKSEKAEEEEGGISIPGLPARFSYAELEVATDGFKHRVGSGGFGEVYKGELPDRTVVAVKRITGIGQHARRELYAEIATIGTVRHANLVRLVGFCTQGPYRLLVHEYMNRGSLDRVLFGGDPVLEWTERLDIAVGAARGLAYLHSGCIDRIIHCDVKPENILLHESGPAKVSDFGLAKLVNRDQASQFTTMRGTRGYLAPEWLTNSAVSDKTDVYSFGMVLLEMVSGRRNRTGGSGSAGSVGPGGLDEYFPLVALEMHERRQYAELADRRLEGRVEEEVERVVRTALCCLHEEPGLRPSMAIVASILEGAVAAPEPHVESLGFLRLHAGHGIMNDGNELVRRGDRVLFAPQPSISSQEVSGPR